MAPAHSALGRQALLAAGLAAALAACAPTARAAIMPRAWIRRAIQSDRGERQAQAPAVARFQMDAGGAFVLDRTARTVLLKFDDSPEVWVLSPSRAPRGDLIYRNDVGEPVLRATHLGGVTVFTSRRPRGSAAALSGGSSPLRLAPLGPVGLYQRLFQSSVRCSRLAQHLVGFDALDASPASDGVIADAALVTAIGMANVAARPDGKSQLARVTKVSFVQGARPEAALRGGVLTVTVTPKLGIAGRPSSEWVAQVIETAPEAPIRLRATR